MIDLFFGDGIIGRLIDATEFWAAIIGALIGGLVSFAAQFYAIRHAENERKTHDLKQQQARAHALLYKLVRIHSNFKSIGDHLESAWDRLDSEKRSKQEIWSHIPAMASFPAPVVLENDEMVLLMSLEDTELANKTLMLDENCNHFVETFKLFCLMRSQLTAQLPVDEISGNQFTTNLSPEQVMRFAPEIHQLNDLAEQIRDWAKEKVPTTYQISRDAADRCKVKLNLRFAPVASKVSSETSND